MRFTIIKKKLIKMFRLQCQIIQKRSIHIFVQNEIVLLLRFNFFGLIFNKKYIINKTRYAKILYSISLIQLVQMLIKNGYLKIYLALLLKI